MQRSAFLKQTVVTFLTVMLPEIADAGGMPARIAQIEQSTGGRLGVSIVDTQTQRRIEYRAHELFPMCSTFKVALVAAVLSRTSDGAMRRPVRYGKADLLDYAPVTRKNVTHGQMALDELCAAAIEYSDNTAANILLREIGGPPAVNAYLRSIGDSTTRLDRTEPSLNTAIPGDVRDTTTPRAMADDLTAIVLHGKGIGAAQRSFIAQCMQRCKTGGTLLRAGVPKGWTVLDKTGMGGPHNAYGDSNTRNDIAVIRRPHDAPLVITVYLTGAKVDAQHRDAAIASVARLVGTA